MFNSPIIEVATGRIYVYLLLSLAVSALAEMIQIALKTRARLLETGLLNLFNKQTAMATAICKDPVIFSLFKGEYLSKSIEFSRGRLQCRTRAAAGGFSRASACS